MSRSSAAAAAGSTARKRMGRRSMTPTVSLRPGGTQRGGAHSQFFWLSSEPQMKDKTKIILGAGAFVVAVSTLHAIFNVDWSSISNEQKPAAERLLNVAYVPVT